MLGIVPSRSTVQYHCMQFQGKLMNQTWENGKKTNTETDFDSFGPNLGSKNFFMGFTFTRC